MLSRFASCKTVVFMCLRLILKLILRVLGVRKEDCENIFAKNKHRNCAIHNCTECLLSNSRDGKCSKYKDESSCDADSESGANCVEKSRKFPSKKKRLLRRRSLQTAPSVSPQTRRYSLSSGISTGSDAIISEFEKINYYSADCDVSMRSVTEIENISLRAVLEGLIKEKLEMQDTIKHQENILDSGNYLDYLVLERKLKKLFSKFELSQNSSMESCDTCCDQSSRRSAPHFQRSCSMPNDSREFKELNDILSCCKKHDIGDTAPTELESATETRNSVSVPDGVDRDKRLERLTKLESENVRLEQYINRLLFMVLEGSPSVLEASKSISNNQKI